jgi:xylulokinase
MRFLIGVDIGTQGSKGALISETGRVLATSSVEQEVSVPRPGWAEHDAEVGWWQAFVEIVRTLLLTAQVDPRDIVAVNVSALMPVFTPVDDQGRPLRPAILYADTRAHAQMMRMNQELGMGQHPSVVGEFTPELTLQDLGPKIVWYQQHEPERWRQTRQILGAQPFITRKLTGRNVMDLGTAIGFRPFFDPVRREWDLRVCERYGLPLALLPDLMEMTEIAGTVTPEAAAETGLAPGTAVIAGSVDYFAEMISTGADEPGDIIVTYGTTLCLTALSSEPIGHTPGLGSMLGGQGAFSDLYPGMYGVGGGMLTSAALSRWFRDKFSQGERRAEKDLGISAYALLGLEAEAVPPGADGLIALPYFSGERSPIHDDLARGVLFGLTLAHGRGHVYRALLEGVAYGLEHHLHIIRDAGVPLRRIVATGGGARSRLWTQIISDVTGLPQTVIAPSNSALGAAFLAGKALGIFDHISDVRLWARPEREVHPRDDVHELYQRYYAIYRRLYEQTKEEMHDLARLTDEAASGQVKPVCSALAVGAS